MSDFKRCYELNSPSHKLQTRTLMGILTDSALITAFKYTQPLTGVQLLDEDSCLTG